MTLNFKTLLNRGQPVVAAALLAATLAAGISPVSAAQAQETGQARALPQIQPGDNLIVDARDAFRKKDRAKLATLRAAALGIKHPLAMWVDYWELNNRLGELQQAEVNDFTARWPGTYVEDRFRNDWLLELGRRQDWANFKAEYPRFRMNDDKEVTCYALLNEQFAGKDVREAALTAWLSQRDADDGCSLLAATLTDAKQFTSADAWRKARAAIEAGRLRAARQAAALVSVVAAEAVIELGDNPARYLTRKASTASRANSELTTLALMRMAANDPDAAAGQLNSRWDARLPADLAALAWASIGKQAATKLQPEAADYFQRADQRAAKAGRDYSLSDDVLAWKVRSALRADDGRPRWQMVVQSIDSMSATEQREPSWVYWKARAVAAMAAESQEGDSMRALSREQMRSIAGQLNFYSSLAAENLNQPLFMPPRPMPLTPEERDSPARNPGFARALQLIAIGLRGEGVREWNYSIRGMNDRELLAAAQLACDAEVWDRCINTSDRTKTEIDLEQRFPMPFRKDVVARANEAGIDPAYVYGLIRQESRFVMDARSGVGASGLMQVMPATARWTAKKMGIPYTNDLIADRDTNLRIGTAYLRFVLDDFGGSQALAAAAYNAGPGRSRKWRDGPILEAAAWAENVPFPETRDYVKKVLSNATYYAALLNNQPPTMKARLGRTIAPASQTSPLDNELP
jgi:soluble lytic murein transglycosylase